jgi:hypothetical protein
VTHQGIARYLVSSRSGVHRDGALGQEPLDPQQVDLTAAPSSANPAVTRPVIMA